MRHHSFWVADSDFVNSGFFRHSSFVIRIGFPSSGRRAGGSDVPAARSFLLLVLVAFGRFSFLDLLSVLQFPADSLVTAGNDLLLSLQAFHDFDVRIIR